MVNVLIKGIAGASLPFTDSPLHDLCRDSILLNAISSVVYNFCTLFGLRSGKFYATKLFSLFSLCIVVKPFPIHLIYFLRFGVRVNIDVLNERVKTLRQERCKNSIFFAFRCSIDGHTQVHFVSLCEKLFCMKRHIANWF